MSDEELERSRKEQMASIDRWLDHEYGVSYTRLEELHDFVIDQDMKHQEEKDKEIERLHSIIEEVRELVQRYNILIGYYDGYDCYDETHDTYSHDTVKEELLEILNKEDI